MGWIHIIKGQRSKIETSHRLAGLMKKHSTMQTPLLQEGKWDSTWESSFQEYGTVRGSVTLVFFFFLFYNDVLQCCHIVLWPSPNTPVRPHSGAEVSSCKVSTPDVPHINVTRKRHLFCVSRINTIKYTSHLGDRKCTNTDSVSVNLDLCSSGIDPKRNNEVKVLTLSFRVVWGCSRF